MSEHSPHPDREDERFDMSVAQVWVQERISCPHRDILRAYRAGGLKEGERDYVRFHVETIECPFCQANLEDLEVASDAEKQALSQQVTEARDRSLESSGVFLKNLRDSSTGSV